MHSIVPNQINEEKKNNQISGEWILPSSMYILYYIGTVQYTRKHTSSSQKISCNQLQLICEHIY